MVDDYKAQEDLHHELKILEQYSHPSIISIFEILHDSQCFYIVSESIPFGSLYNEYVNRKVTTERGNMTEREVRYIAK